MALQTFNHKPSPIFLKLDELEEIPYIHGCPAEVLAVVSLGLLSFSLTSLLKLKKKCWESVDRQARWSGHSAMSYKRNTEVKVSRQHSTDTVNRVIAQYCRWLMIGHWQRYPIRLVFGPTCRNSCSFRFCFPCRFPHLYAFFCNFLNVLGPLFTSSFPVSPLPLYISSSRWPFLFAHPSSSNFLCLNSI